MTRIRDVLARHWAIHHATMTPLDGGMNSFTWLVEHAGSTYVAKEVRQEDLPYLASGCEVATRLARAGITTGRPVPTTQGALLATEPAMALLEHVPGRELDGTTADEQRWMADTLAAVHAASGTTTGLATADFFDWLKPDVSGLEAHPWLPAAIRKVRTEVDRLDLTWSLLHTDPAPEAFVHNDCTGIAGLIDWTGADRGPVLYDVASAVMYLGGPDSAATFLTTYRDQGVLPDDEWRHLGAFRRFRWAVQAVYFAKRLAEADLTGVTGQADNEHGLADAKHGLAELGLATT